jgi:sugar (pentulose or hexulose) kinase
VDLPGTAFNHILLSNLDPTRFLTYPLVDRVTGAGDSRVYATGGGSRSDVWIQWRANIICLVIYRLASGKSAFGVAVLAATGTRYPWLAEAVPRMVSIEGTFFSRRPLCRVV